MRSLSSEQPARNRYCQEARNKLNTFIRAWLVAMEEASDCTKDDRHMTVLTTSPESVLAETVCKLADELAAHDISLKVVVSRINQEETIARFLRDCDQLLNRGELGGIRWLRNTCLLDAHEQLTLGHKMSWSGDTMRRALKSRNNLEIFEYSSGHANHLARASFKAIWLASNEMPATPSGRSIANNLIAERMVLARARSKIAGFGAGLFGAMITRH